MKVKNRRDLRGEDQETPPQFDAAFRSQLRQLLRWRRDVRRFRPEPPDRSVVVEALAEACRGPSVGNSQPWRFVFVESDDRRRAIRANFEEANRQALQDYRGEQARLYASLKLAGLDQAPVHLAVFAQTDPSEGSGLGAKTMPETFSYSVVAAVQTLWLLLRAQGIGMGWVSILDTAELNRLLDVDPDWIFVAYLCIGYPESEDEIPELVRAGWQERLPSQVFLLRR